MLIEGRRIDTDQSRELLDEIQRKQELLQMTFEGNHILDKTGVGNFLKYLKNFDKMESINIRCNNMNDQLIKDISEGINLKKELRVSLIVPPCLN